MIVICIPSRDGQAREEVTAGIVAAVKAAPDVPCQVRIMKNRYNVATCRNQAVASFLKSDASHLLFVDDDVILPDNAIKCLAENLDKPVIGGQVPAFKSPPGELPYTYVQVLDFQNNWRLGWTQGIEKVTGLGGGCMMVSREVFEKLGHPWFRWVELYDRDTVRELSDDVDFCQRAMEAGFDIWVDGRVRCGHIKQIDVRLIVDKVL